MKIGLDIMGGDFAPAEAIKGVQLYFESNSDDNIHLVLYGNTAATAPYISLIEPYRHRYTFIETEDIIGMTDHPTKAMKEKPDSGIAKGFYMLHKGEIDSFISAGNSGAMLVGAMYSVKPIDGVLRPCIVSPVPRIDGKYNFLLDVGLNADCKPENLVQFAQLGSLYAKHMLDIEKPNVGLLNIGEEEGKGNILAQATYPLLKEQKDINFIGNVEGRDVFLNKAQVIVCEGFVGNITLKLAESIYEILRVEKGLDDPFLDSFCFENYGGLPILGINKPVLIMHGISHAKAFKNVIGVACQYVGSNLTDAIKAQFKQVAAE
jgi:phosphate acyltransferase